MRLVTFLLILASSWAFGASVPLVPGEVKYLPLLESEIERG